MTTTKNTHSHQVLVGGKTYTTNAKAHSGHLPETPDPLVAEAKARTDADQALSDRIAALEANVPPLPPDPIPSRKVEGFGAVTTGGDGYPAVHVTNLDDAGPGSLREAVTGSDRTIVFDVAGTITLQSICDVRGNNITIAGETAPGSGITLVGDTDGNWPLRINGAYHDIIVRNIRHRGAGPVPHYELYGASLALINGAYRVVVDHCSFSGARATTLGSWRNCYDVTFSNNILGPGVAADLNYALLIGGFSSRHSIHHNLIAGSDYRNPAVGWNESGDAGPASTIVADVRCNLVWDYGLYGTTVYENTKANVVKNYYQTLAHPGSSQDRAIRVESAGLGYIAGNYSKDGSSFAASNHAEFPVDPYAVVTEEATAQLAAAAVLAGAGCRVGGLDAYDAALIAGIAL